MRTNECHHCQNLIEFPDHGVGEHIRCPHCGTSLVLTALSTTRPGESPVHLHGSDPSAESEIQHEAAKALHTLEHGRPHESRRARRMRKRRQLAAAILIVAGVLVGAAIIAIKRWRLPEMDPALHQAAISQVERDAAALGAPAGLFGAKWLMSPKEVKAILPAARAAAPDVLGEDRPVYDRPATVEFHFTQNALLAIAVRFAGASSPSEYERVQARLSKDYGAMTRPARAGNCLLFSSKKMKQFVVQHCLSEASGASQEQIFFYVGKAGQLSLTPPNRSQ